MSEAMDIDVDEGPDVLVALTTPGAWTIGEYDLECGDEAVMPEGLYRRYEEDFVRIDVAERAAELVACDEDGEELYGYDDRRAFLSRLGELPDERSDDALRARLEDLAGV